MMKSPSVCPGQTGEGASLVCDEIGVGQEVRASSNVTAHNLTRLMVATFLIFRYLIIRTKGTTLQTGSGQVRLDHYDVRVAEVLVLFRALGTGIRNRNLP